MWEDRVQLLAGQNRLEDNYRDPNMVPKANKADMTGMMEVIDQYLRLHCIMRAPLAYIIRKAITVCCS